VLQGVSSQIGPQNLEETVIESPVTPQTDYYAGLQKHCVSVACFVVLSLLGCRNRSIDKKWLLARARQGDCLRYHARTIRRGAIRFALVAVAVPACIFLIETWWH
jgi:hypothetical protein